MGVVQKYPQYRASQWIDTSEESMSKENATILYGVQIRTHKGGTWMHCHRDGEPLIFKSPSECESEIKRLQASPPEEEKEN